MSEWTTEEDLESINDKSTISQNDRGGGSSTTHNRISNIGSPDVLPESVKNPDAKLEVVIQVVPDVPKQTSNEFKARRNIMIFKNNAEKCEK